jgi:hypothetical protein
MYLGYWLDGLKQFLAKRMNSVPTGMSQKRKGNENAVISETEININLK